LEFQPFSEPFGIKIHMKFCRVMLYISVVLSVFIPDQKENREPYSLGDFAQHRRFAHRKKFCPHQKGKFRFIALSSDYGI
jgi:hypothetical protein